MWGRITLDLLLVQTHEVLTLVLTLVLGLMDSAPTDKCTNPSRLVCMSTDVETLSGLWVHANTPKRPFCTL